MRRIAKQYDASVMPFAGDAMVDLEQIGADQFGVLRAADERHGLLAQLVVGELALAFEHRVEKAPAFRLTHEDHPFLGIAEIAEIGKVARVLDVEIDLQVDQREALRAASGLRPRRRDAHAPCCVRRRRPEESWRRTSFCRPACRARAVTWSACCVKPVRRCR